MEIILNNFRCYKQASFNLGKNGIVLINGPSGIGKCLGRDTPILMYDGTVKNVQDIITGDKLMGDNSKPRNVLSTTTGIDDLYEIKPTSGDSYIVNTNHILTLKVAKPCIAFVKNQWVVLYINKEELRYLMMF